MHRQSDAWTHTNTHIIQSMHRQQQQGCDRPSVSEHAGEFLCNIINLFFLIITFFFGLLWLYWQNSWRGDRKQDERGSDTQQSTPGRESNPSPLQRGQRWWWSSRWWLFSVLYRWQLNLFWFLEDAPHLIQEAPSVPTTWKSYRLFNSVWECPYRVADSCET